jgi:hypothetical protein
VGNEKRRGRGEERRVVLLRSRLYWHVPLAHEVPQHSVFCMHAPPLGAHMRHVPLEHFWVQHWASLEHSLPPVLQRPPQISVSQSESQQGVDPLHGAPSARQAPPVPLVAVVPCPPAPELAVLVAVDPCPPALEPVVLVACWPPPPSAPRPCLSPQPIAFKEPSNTTSAVPEIILREFLQAFILHLSISHRNCHTSLSGSISR